MLRIKIIVIVIWILTMMRMRMMLIIMVCMIMIALVGLTMLVFDRFSGRNSSRRGSASDPGGPRRGPELGQAPAPRSLPGQLQTQRGQTAPGGHLVQHGPYHR